MKKILLTGIFLALLMGVGVQNSFAGGEFRASLGGNFCIENDKTNCGSTDPLGKSVSFTLSSGWRIFEVLGVYLDFGAAGMGGGAVEKGAFLHVMPAVRGYIPFLMFEGHLGFGLGFAGYFGTLKKSTVENVKKSVLDNVSDGFGLSRAISYYSFWSMKFNWGVTFKPIDMIGLGLNMEYILTTNGKSKSLVTVEELKRDKNLKLINTKDINANQVSDILSVQALVFVKF